MRTFEELHAIARTQAEDAEPPDVQTGADAQLMVATLFDWIAANVDEAGRASVMAAVAEAFHWTDPPEPRPFCLYCKSEIDPAMCQCGASVDGHTIDDGHSPVPLGCTCHLLDDVALVPKRRAN